MKRFLRKVFGLNRLYDRKYGAAYLIDGLIVSMVILLVNIYVNNSLQIAYGKNFVVFVMALIIIVPSIYFIRELVQTIVITKRIKSRSYSSEVSISKISQFVDSSVNIELDVHDNIRTITVKPEFSVYDVRYDFYRQSKGGSYKSREAFYTVIEYKLPRNLPHIVFDSRRAKGRQFNTLFVGSQKLTLEGNFSDYYDVYSPKFYQVDTLSFITPEVMQSMLSMHEYDIEIKGDSLFCFGPLLTNEEIATFEAKTYDLYAHLKNNLESYRDQRLDYQISKHRTTDFGRSLLISPRRYLLSLVMSGLITTQLLYLAYYENSSEYVLNKVFITVVAIFLYDIFRIVKLTRKNASLEREFKHQQSINRQVSKL